MKVKKIYFILLIFALVGCQSEYQKLLTGSDYEEQYTTAVSYYEKGDYLKAYTLFENILPAYRLTEKAEKINYYIANCYFKENDFLMSAYYFERFTMSFPASELLEEAYYYTAVCYYYNSPKSSLDQSHTVKAINSFQMYLNKYNKGKYSKESNDYIAELRAKIEKKAFDNSKIYFELADYKAAVIALKNCLKDFPDSKYREEIIFLTLRSSFLLAENSVESKKIDRYEIAANDYKAYIDEYPKGQRAKDAEKIFLQVKKHIN